MNYIQIPVDFCCIVPNDLGRFLSQTNKQVNTLKEKAKNAIIFPIVISNVTGFAFKGEAGTVYFKAQSTSDVQKEFMSNVCESENTYPLPFN